MDLLLAVLLGAAIVAVPAGFTIRFIVSEADKGRAIAQERRLADQTYITELQNRLGSHTWGEFAQLQNEVDSAAAQTTRFNSFGEPRPEEAYGERAEEVVEAFLRDAGVDLEGPTVG